jgi:exonuclease III
MFVVRLEYRQQWDRDFMAYLKKLDKKKPVILCGDLNVAHKEIGTNYSMGLPVYPADFS